MRRSSPATRNGLAALLAVTVAAGYLLVSGAVDPLLRQAVTMAIGHDQAAAPDPGLNATPIADWQYFDDRPEWSSLRKVPTLPAQPAEPNEPARPEVAPPENPKRWQFNGPAPMPHYSLKAMGSCPQRRGQGYNVERLTATPGKKRATLSWWDLGDPDTRSYQVAIVPVGATGNPVGFTDESTQTEPVRFIDVAAPKTCKDVSVVITGLKSGDAYRFWLLANNESQVQQKRKYNPTRGETETITVL